MGTRGKDDGARIDYSEGAPPAASAFANGAAEALGASRMDDEDEGDWDSDEEEQAELAAAEAAAKGKMVGNVRGGFDCRGGGWMCSLVVDVCWGWAVVDGWYMYV